MGKEETENVRKAKFYEIKEFDYFKQILKSVEDIDLKEYLPEHVYTMTTRTFNHEKYVYIATKNSELCEIGTAIDPLIKELPKKVQILRVSKIMDNIFKHVLILDVPVLKNLKMRDRLSLFSACTFENYPFNRTLFRKGEQFDGVYYIVEGEMKIICEKPRKKIKLISKGHFIGLEELSENSEFYMSSIVSNSNSTQLLLIKQEHLLEENSESEITEFSLRNLFLSHHKQEKNDGRSTAISPEVPLTCRNEKKHLTHLKLHNFIKKVDEFRSNTTKKDFEFNEYVKSKKMMLQLKETMQISKIQQKNKKQKENFTIRFDHTLERQDKIRPNTHICRSRLWKSIILKRIELEEKGDQNKVVEMFHNIAQSQII